MARQTLWAVVLVTASLLSACATPGYVEERVVVRAPPPPPREEVIGVAPSRVSVWIPGRWIRRGDDWFWLQGHWERRPRAGADWVPGHWVRRGGLWEWVPGHWR